MSSIDETGANNGMVMPVAPMMGNNGGGGMFGNNGNDGGWWVILLIIILIGGRNWGGNGNGGGNMYGYVDPSFGIQAGFNQASLSSGISNIQQDICNGFANVNGNIQNGFFQAEIANNSRQMADMQQNFALQSQLAQCCCDNRLATANLQATIAQENCADRQAVNDALIAVTNQMNAGFQSIKDEFCQDRLDRKDEVIAELRSQLNERDRQASQNAQTSALIANNEAQTVAIEQYLNPTAHPAYIVPNPNCCYNQSAGCGCVMA